MNFELIPAAYVAQELSKKITVASFDPENEWFFFDGAFNFATNIEISVNTWLHENFVAVYNKEIVAYFEGIWSRPLDIISGFRTINFSKKYSRIFILALFKYLDYLFVNRGCRVLNWTVALQNCYAMKQYERFVADYCGHRVGIRHHTQKSYTGKISDSYLYEITQEEYLEWKARGFRKRLVDA
jgi:hypothetical protein